MIIATDGCIRCVTGLMFSSVEATIENDLLKKNSGLQKDSALPPPPHLRQ